MNMQSIRDGLSKLGVRRLLFAIHDVSFPSDPDEDIGRGSPATRASARLFTYLRTLGFTGIQLGPQGQTARSNPSPYDSTIFSRHLGNIGVASFAQGGPFAELLPAGLVERSIVDTFGPARHVHAYDVSHRLVETAFVALERGARPDLAAALREFKRTNHGWLVPDALHAAICASRSHSGFRAWPAPERDLFLHRAAPAATIEQLSRAHERAIDVYALGQMLVHREHARVRKLLGLPTAVDTIQPGAAHADAAPFLLYGDMQIGYSDADAWRHQAAFLDGYLMGAPPSRTNPDGQPWGYPVLDPAQLEHAAGALVVARAEKAFAEYDGLRIDHPHGLVCPWVYRTGTGDDGQAVRDGARLFESPDLPDHPALAAFAIARPEQIDRDVPRFADRWVRGLDAEQVARYAILVDALIDAAEKHGRSREDLSCEVLSTLPTPLAHVLARHSLGRWRVTQKADLDNPRDVYRLENAQPSDWVMLGNHDTAPILAVIRGWPPAKREQWARHLAARLRLARPERLASDGFLATAMLAELFASPAENVSIFFADLFGYEERFNVPGLVADVNWSLRLPHDFERLHADRLAKGEAIDLPLAIELALAARA